MDNVLLYDTTLRDGSQTPGAGLNIENKVNVAKRLAKMGVNVIEPGFPAASKTDFEATVEISKFFSKKGPIISAFAIINPKTVDSAWEAVKKAKNKRVHLGIGTSNVHMEQKLGKDRNQILDQIHSVVKHAAKYDWEVQFFAEDSTRTEPKFLWEALSIAIDAGATYLNIPDTVGYCIPRGYGEVIKGIMKNVKNIKKATVGTHTHNDMGLAIACAVSGVENGAGLIFREHPEIGVKTNLDPALIIPTAKYIAELNGIMIAQNQPLVGKNAFRTGSGLHQFGLIKDVLQKPRPKKFSYSAFDPKVYGGEFEFVYNFQTGSNALLYKLNQLGYGKVEPNVQQKFYEEFMKVANIEKNLRKETMPDSVFHAIAKKLKIPKTNSPKPGK
ncbi:hypothetical protein HYY75_09975 [bacterium]|nr:hypothetical protein [bacterium]